MASSRPPRASEGSRGSIAIDLGAESCRVSLLRWTGQGPVIQLVHRFPNGPVRAEDGSLRWPLQRTVDGVEEGVRRAARLAPEGIASLAVDGWAVDYVRLNPHGEALGDPFCYRDERNARAAVELHTSLPAHDVRAINGIEVQPLNTIYQLVADRRSGRKPAPWLNLPEYLLCRWGAAPVAEYTNATHTGLVDLRTGTWSPELFARAGLDLRCAPRLVPPGTSLGMLTGPLCKEPGLAEVQLIAPACHDTASAIAGIAESGDDWAYISCGTWSLVGALLSQPLNTPAAQQDNFTNLGAVGGKICFHKGLNGMWMLKQCLEEWAKADAPWDVSALVEAAEHVETPQFVLPLEDTRLLGMGSMPTRINAVLRSHDLPSVSETSARAPEVLALLAHSLAHRYADILRRVEALRGKGPFHRVVMVGGGAQNTLLRKMTAKHTGLEVTTGPTESSTLGNFAVQSAVLDGADSSRRQQFGERVTRFAELLQST